MAERPQELREIDQKGLRKFLENLTSRYWFLKAQAAAQGIMTDPAILMEIEKLEKEIREAKADLTSWNQAQTESDIGKFEGTMKEKRPNAWFAFLNREGEKDLLLTPSARFHLFVVDAPPSYGKSMLLNKVETEYKENRRWDVARVDFKQEGQCDTRYKLLQALIARVECGDPYCKLDMPLSTDQTESMLDNLVEIISVKPGLLLSLDSMDRAPDNLSTYLKDELMPTLYRRLTSLKPPMEFRCIVAGRRIVGRWAPEGPKPPIEPVKLRAFDVEDIQKELNRIYQTVARGIDEREVPRLARRIWYLSGGHPGLIAYMLRRIEERPSLMCDSFTREWLKVQFDEVYEAMQAEIPAEVRNVFGQVAVWRLIESDLLEKFGSEIQVISDQFTYGLDLLLRLMKDQYCTFDDSESGFRNEIYRRILLEHMHQAGENVASLHKIALKICESHLQDHNKCLTYRGERLVVEALYHYVCSQEDPSLEDLTGRLRTYLSLIVEHYPLSKATDPARSIMGRLNRDYELQEEVYRATRRDDLLQSELFPILEQFIADKEYRHSLQARE